MIRAELAAAIAEELGMAKSKAYGALGALEAQLHAEGLAKHAVTLDNFGTFWPRKKSGKRTGRSIAGGTVTYENWKLVPNPQEVLEDEFAQRAAERAEIPLAQFMLVLQGYKHLVTQALRKGASVSSHGGGSFKVTKRKARVFRRADGSVSSRSPAKRAVVYKAGKNGAHQKFVALPGLV